MAHGEPLVWASTAGARPGPWVWSPRIDAFWIAGGGFFLFLPAALLAAQSQRATDALLALFLHLSVLCNYPHYTATWQVLVRERAKRPSGFWWLLASGPIMLAAFAAGAYWEGLGWVLIMRLYMTWSTHHYAAQNFGIASMYCHRQGTPLQPVEKLQVQFAFLGLGAYMMIMGNAALGSLADAASDAVIVSGGATVPIAGFPSWIYGPCLLLLVACAGAMWRADRQVRARLGRGLPRVVWAMFGTSLAWFALPNLYGLGGVGLFSPSLTALLVWAATPFFHCAQYLALTMDRNRKTGPVKPIWLYVGLVAYGFILFHAPPQFLPEITGLSSVKSTGLLIALVNIHHFWMDGLMWRRPKKAPRGAPPVAISPAPAK